MDFQTILYQTRDQIAFITFNRPESLNAMNRQMTRELVDVCQQVEEDSGIRVAIFTGAGEKAFSAGMDLKERAETSFSPIERRQQKLTSKIYTQARAVAAITKPTIAAIRGYCVGGGLEFALACDLRVAAEDAKLGLTEVRRGIIPGAGGTQRLSRAVGVTKAMEMCLTGDTVSGLEAKSLGLVNNAVPSADVLKTAEDLAGRILKGAPMSVAFIKEAIKKGVELPLEEGLRLEADLSALIGITEDAKEGPRAFAEKRAPVWKGK
ncbi:MAG TPA: enoyl-CoA hydratase/isomerase family protein [Candidatus Binatia bacterium]|nr:enoyl-CoA hydratase/isomerase family protein [Candidatus Binatia bacterium]